MGDEDDTMGGNIPRQQLVTMDIYRKRLGGIDQNIETFTKRIISIEHRLAKFCIGSIAIIILLMISFIMGIVAHVKMGSDLHNPGRPGRQEQSRTWCGSEDWKLTNTSLEQRMPLRNRYGGHNLTALSQDGIFTTPTAGYYMVSLYPAKFLNTALVLKKNGQLIGDSETTVGKTSIRYLNKADQLWVENKQNRDGVKHLEVITFCIMLT